MESTHGAYLACWLQPPRRCHKFTQVLQRIHFVSGQLMQKGGKKIVGTRGHASKEKEFLGAASLPLTYHPRMRGHTVLPLSVSQRSAN